jgi:hypothetical protein
MHAGVVELVTLKTGAGREIGVGPFHLQDGVAMPLGALAHEKIMG